MKEWKRYLGLGIGVGSIIILLMDLIIFATGRVSCHYSPYGEWIIELPLLLIGLVLLFQINDEFDVYGKKVE